MLDTIPGAPAPTALSKARKPRIRQHTLYVGMTIPALVILALVLIPFLYGVSLSLTDYTLISPVFHFVGLANYQRLFSGATGFWHALRITFEYVALVIAIELPLGTVLALALHSPRLWLPGVMRSLVLIPLMIPPVVAGLMWKIIVSPGQIVPEILSCVGLGNWPWLSGLGTALLSVVIMDSWINIPFVTLIVFAGLQGLPKTPEEAASIDGANSLQRIWHVTLPQLKPFLTLAFLFRLIMGLQQFDLIFGSTQGGPVNATLTAVLDAYQQAMQFNNVAYSMSEIVILWAVSYILSWVVFRWQFAKRPGEGVVR
ncbi:MAG: sugar ABC transporter permease [Alicyclobacillus sp.]|nr:sugar ABC transporter permease [Alicyclobacillus sp.]